MYNKLNAKVVLRQREKEGAGGNLYPKETGFFFLSLKGEMTW